MATVEFCTFHTLPGDEWRVWENGKVEYRYWAHSCVDEAPQWENSSKADLAKELFEKPRRFDLSPYIKDCIRKFLGLSI